METRTRSKCGEFSHMSKGCRSRVMMKITERSSEAATIIVAAAYMNKNCVSAADK